MRSSHRLWPLEAASLAIVAAAGGLCLATPFLSDQALFTLYARQITHGAVLYRDLFDIKQPGIFAFYTAGGLLFGFDERGIHLFELLYWIAFSLFAMFALRPYFSSRWAAAVAPALTIAVYYMWADVSDLTQIEILVAFPILVAWWLIDRSPPGTRSAVLRYAGAGLAAAAVVLLKYLYLLIVLAFLAYAVRRSWKRGTPTAEVRRCLASFAIALLLPLVLVAAYFAAYGQLERIWWVYFDFVPKSQLWGTKAFADLKFGARRFMIGHAPLLILAAVACIDALKRPALRRSHLAAGMALWVVSGAAAFVVQGWWQYKWLLFTVPVGLLAVAGLEALAGSAIFRLPRWAVAAGAVLALVVAQSVVGAPRLQTAVLLLSVTVGTFAGVAPGLMASDPRLRTPLSWLLGAALVASVGLVATTSIDRLPMLAAHRFALTAADRTEYQRAVSTAYRDADHDVQEFENRARLPGTLHVFVDPVVLLRANRPPAVPFLGQDLHSYDSRAWREMDRDLRSAMPAYIVLDRPGEQIIRSRSSSIVELIDARYQVAFDGAMGTWYVRRP